MNVKDDSWPWPHLTHSELPMHFNSAALPEKNQVCESSCKQLAACAEHTSAWQQSFLDAEKGWLLHTNAASGERLRTYRTWKSISAR